MSKQKLKIAVFVHTFPCYSETYILNQITDLIDKGHDLDIYARHYNHNATIHENIVKYQLLNRLHCENPPSRIKRLYLLFTKLFSCPRKLLPTLNFFKYGRQALNLVLFSTVFSYLPEKKIYDIVHIHFAINGNHVLSLQRLGLFQQAKLITSFHGEDGDYPYINPYSYQDLFHSSSFTVNSEYLRNIIVANGYSNQKIVKIPEGLNTELFKKSNTNRISQVIKIIYIGRLVEWKGSNFAVKAASVLREKIGDTFEIIMVGGGEMKEELEQLIANEKLENIVKLQGVVAQQNLIKLMDTCDIFLHPAITGTHGNQEYQGLVIQEAQSMELPVVASDVGGIKEGMLDGITGFLVQEKNVEQIVEKLQYLIENPSIRKKMGQEGRKYVQENFDSKILGDRLDKLYYSLLKNSEE